MYLMMFWTLENIQYLLNIIEEDCFFVMRY